MESQLKLRLLAIIIQNDNFSISIMNNPPLNNIIARRVENLLIKFCSTFSALFSSTFSALFSSTFLTIREGLPRVSRHNVNYLFSELCRLDWNVFIF